MPIRKNNYKYSISDLQKKAEELSDEITPPFSVLLNGNIGAGKTTFSQFFVKNIAVDKSVVITSPTFNIVQIYETIKGDLWHVDLYRLKEESEILDLGLIEAMHENICLIEWPDPVRMYLKNCNYVEIYL